MTEKRYSYFKSEFTGLYVISDEKHRETFSGIDNEYNCSRIVRILNTKEEENKQLKTKVNFYKYFQKDARELEKENEQLKQEGADVERLIDDLGSEELRRQYEEIINGDVE